MIRVLLLVSCLLFSGCLATGISAGRLGMDAIRYLTKEPPVIVKTAECGNIDTIKPSRLDTDETKRQIAKQNLHFKKLCGED